MASTGMASAAEGLRRAYQAVLKRFKNETTKQGGDQELPVPRKDLAVLVQEAQSRPQEAAPEVRTAVDALASRLHAGGTTASEVPVPRAESRRVMSLIAGRLQQAHGSSSLLGGGGAKPAPEGQLPKVAIPGDGAAKAPEHSVEEASPEALGGASAAAAEAQTAKSPEGEFYDHVLIELVERCAADGQIGYPEAKKIWQHAQEGEGLTDARRATLEHSMKKYRFSAKAENFMRTYLDAGTHNSFYKVVDGVKYDRQLLESAEKFAADGQVSWKEAQELFKSALDGEGLTGTERATLEYALKTLKFTDKAAAYLREQLKKSELAPETNLHESEPSDDAIKASLEAAYSASSRQTLSRQTSDHSVAEGPQHSTKAVSEAASHAGLDSAKDKAALLREKLLRLRKGARTAEPALEATTTSSEAAAASAAPTQVHPSPDAAEQDARVTTGKTMQEGNVVLHEATLNTNDAAFGQGQQSAPTKPEAKQEGGAVTRAAGPSDKAGEVRLPETAHIPAAVRHEGAEDHVAAPAQWEMLIQSSALQASDAKIDAERHRLLSNEGAAEPPATALDDNVQTGDGTSEMVATSAREVAIDAGKEFDQAQSAGIAKDVSSPVGDRASGAHSGDAETGDDHAEGTASAADCSLAETATADNFRLGVSKTASISASRAVVEYRGDGNRNPGEDAVAEFMDTAPAEAIEAVDEAIAPNEVVGEEQAQHQAAARDSDGSVAAVAAALKPGTSTETELDSEEEKLRAAEAAKRAEEEEKLRAAEAAKRAEEEKKLRAAEAAKRAEEEKALRAAEAAKQAEEAALAAEAAKAAAQAAALERLQGSLKAAVSREAALLEEAQAAAAGADAAAGRHAELREQHFFLESQLGSLRASIKTCSLASGAESAHHAAQLTSLRQAADILQQQQMGGDSPKDQKDATAGLREALTCQQKAAEALGQSLSSARAIREVQRAAGKQSRQQVDARLQECRAAAARRQARQQAREEALGAAQCRASAATLATALKAAREECKELKASSVAVCQTLDRLRALSEALAEPAWTERRQAAAAPGLEEQLRSAKQHLLSLSRKHLRAAAGNDASAEVTASDDLALALFNASSAKLQQLADKQGNATTEVLKASRATSNAKLRKLLHLEAGFPWELDQAREGKGVDMTTNGGGETENAALLEETDGEDEEGCEAAGDAKDVVELLLEAQQDPVHVASTEQLREEILFLKRYLACNEERAVQFATSLEAERKQAAADLSTDAPLEEEQSVAAPRHDTSTAKSGTVFSRQSFAKLLLNTPSGKKVSACAEPSDVDAEWNLARGAAMTTEKRTKEATANRSRATALNREILEIQEEQRLLRNELELARSTMPQLIQGTKCHTAEFQLRVEPGELAALQDEVAKLGSDAQKSCTQLGMSLFAQKHLAAAEAARQATTLRYNLWLDEVARLNSCYQKALDHRERAADVLASWDKEHRDAEALDQRVCELQSQLHNLDIEAAAETQGLADLEKARVSAEDACKSAAEQVDQVQQKQFDLTHKSKQAISMSSQLSARLKELQKQQTTTTELQTELDAMVIAQKSKAQEASTELDGLIQDIRKNDEEAQRAQSKMDQLTEDMATQKQQLSSELAEYQQTSEAEAKADADKLDSIKANCSKVAVEIQVRIQNRKARSAAAEKEKAEQQALIEKRERWLVVNRAKLQKLIQDAPLVDLTPEAPSTAEEAKTTATAATETVEAHPGHEISDAVARSPEMSTTPAPAEASLGTRPDLVAAGNSAGVADHLVLEAESRSDAADAMQADTVAIGNKRPQETCADAASDAAVAVKAARLNPLADAQQSETQVDDGSAAAELAGSTQQTLVPFQASPDEPDQAEPQPEVNPSVGSTEEHVASDGGNAALDDGMEAGMEQAHSAENIGEQVEQSQEDGGTPAEDAAYNLHPDVASPRALVTSISPTADEEAIEAPTQAAVGQFEVAAERTIVAESNDSQQNWQSCGELATGSAVPISIGTAAEDEVVGNQLREATQYALEQSEVVVANLRGDELNPQMMVAEVSSETGNSRMAQDDKQESAKSLQLDSAQQYVAAVDSLPEGSLEHQRGEDLLLPHDSANTAVECVGQKQWMSNKWLMWQRSRRKQLVPALSSAGTGPREKRRRTSASRQSDAIPEIQQMQQNFEGAAGLQPRTSTPGGPAVDDDDL